MYEIYGITCNGAVRDHNEDCFLVNNSIIYSGEYYTSSPESALLIAVADGVGGCNAGEVASHLALSRLSRLRFPLTDQFLIKFVQQISQGIHEYGIQNSSAKGLATTLSMLIVDQQQIRILHIGDSRIYRYRDGFLKQLSKDHSLIQALFASGEIKREEMFDHPQKNVVLQVLGVNPDRANLEIDFQHIRGYFENEDIFILCSDGLSDLVHDNDIEIVIQQSTSLTEAMTSLAQKANDKGGTDNITVVGVKHLVKR